MKKIIILLFLVLFSAISYSQESSLDIDKIINDYLIEFRESIDKDASIFIMLDYDFKNVKLNEKNYVVQPSINPKGIIGDNNYMVKFVIYNENNRLILKTINFRIKKNKSKNLELINLMNGKIYKL